MPGKLLAFPSGENSARGMEQARATTPQAAFAPQEPATVAACVARAEAEAKRGLDRTTLALDATKVTCRAHRTRLLPEGAAGLERAAKALRAASRMP